MSDTRPKGVPYNSYYHGNRWDSYNPPKQKCTRCGSTNTGVYSPPYPHDPQWHYKCYSCNPEGYYFAVKA